MQLSSKFFRKYLTTVLLFATLLGAMHHHNDLKQHADCPLCVLSNTVTNADTPVDALFLTQLNLYHEATLTQFANFSLKKRVTTLQARAPPFVSSFLS